MLTQNSYVLFEFVSSLNIKSLLFLMLYLKFYSSVKLPFKWRVRRQYLPASAGRDFGIVQAAKNVHSRSFDSYRDFFATQKYPKRYLGLPVGLGLT